MMLVVFLLLGGVGWAIGYGFRCFVQEAQLWDIWLAFCLLIIGTSIYSGIFPTQDSSPIGPIMAGGILMLSFVLSREKPIRLGLSSVSPKFIGLAFGLAVLQICISFGWVYVLEFLGGEPEQQGLVDSFVEADLQEWILLMLFVSVWAPLTEEILFRGFFWEVIRKYLNSRWSILITGVLFGLIHFGTPHSVVPLSVFGCILGWLRHVSQSIWAPIVCHACNNLFVGGLIFWASEESLSSGNWIF